MCHGRFGHGERLNPQLLYASSILNCHRKVLGSMSYPTGIVGGASNTKVFCRQDPAEREERLTTRSVT